MIDSLGLECRSGNLPMADRLSTRYNRTCVRYSFERGIAVGESEKSIRLVTALVECRPDGEYVPWGIKWYDGTVYPFDRIESYSSRSWALGRDRQSESWRVVVGDGTCRDICHYQNSWYVVHDPNNDTPAARAPQGPCK